MQPNPFTKRLKQALLYGMVIFGISVSLQVSAAEDNTFSENEALAAEQLYLQYQDGTLDIFNLRGKKPLFEREDKSRLRGEQDYTLSLNVFTKLQAEQPERITFNINKVYPFDSGGTCSAMALDFLARYESVAELYRTQPEKLVKAIKKFKPYYRANTTTFTSRQAAFNAIEIKAKYRLVGKEGQERNKLSKMQSLASYHNLSLQPASETISMKNVKERGLEFNKRIKKLPPGSYVIRLVLPENNEKGEQFGHTVVLIKDANYSFFFDNLLGAEELNEDIGEEVRNNLLLRVGYIPELRIYKATVRAGGVRNLSTETSKN